MAEAEDLTLVFLAAHPTEAARVLEALAAIDASVLLASVPPRLGAPVLAAMLPTAAARVLGLLDEARVHALLDAASTPVAVSMLRHVEAPKRARLLAGMPPAAAIATQLLLGFPDDAVGAWTDPEVFALAPGLSAGEVLGRIRAAPMSDLHAVFVVDGGQHLHGWVSLQALVHAPESAPISTLMHPVPATLPAMMPITAARTVPAWESAASLPVLDHDMRLIGVLRRVTLVRAIAERRRPLSLAPGETSVAGELAASYWGIIAGLIGASLALLPAVKRVLPEQK